MGNFSKEYGKERLRIALKAYMDTVEYYEAAGQNKPGDRAIIQQFLRLLNEQ